MIVYDNSRVKAFVATRTLPGEVCIIVGRRAVYITLDELTDIAEAVAEHIESAAEGQAIAEYVNKIPCPSPGPWDPLGQGGGG